MYDSELHEYASSILFLVAEWASVYNPGLWCNKHFNIVIHIWYFYADRQCSDRNGGLSVYVYLNWTEQGFRRKHASHDLSDEKNVAQI